MEVAEKDFGEKTPMMIYTWRKPTGSGGRTGWAKLIKAVDETQPKGAKQYVGEYLLQGENYLPAKKHVIIQNHPDGSAKYQVPNMRVGILDESGIITWAQRSEPCDEDKKDVWNWITEYYSFRDKVKEVLAAGIGTEAQLRALDAKIQEARDVLNKAILEYLALSEGRDPNEPDLSLSDFDQDDVNRLRTGFHAY
jgi:hypothetical protein